MKIEMYIKGLYFKKRSNIIMKLKIFFTMKNGISKLLVLVFAFVLYTSNLSNCFGQERQSASGQNRNIAPNQARLDSFRLAAAEKLRNDWANLKKYSDENSKIPAVNPGEKRVVFMGNSITEFWKTIDPDFFTRNKSIIDRGISGQTTPQMLVRFRNDVIDLNPSAVVILAGTNDIAGNTGPITLENIFGNIVSMAELARANKIKVILCSVLPVYRYPWSPALEPAEKIAKLNSMLQSYASKNKIVYVDYFSPMADEKKGMKVEYSADGVHPNLKGYQVMDDLVEKAISRALKIK